MVSQTSCHTHIIQHPFHTSAGIDYYKLEEAATSVAGLIQFGTVQYNRLKHNFSAMQIADVNETNDGGVATVEIVWQPNPSETPGGAVDWTSIVAD